MLGTVLEIDAICNIEANIEMKPTKHSRNTKLLIHSEYLIIR